MQAIIRRIVLRKRHFAITLNGLSRAYNVLGVLVLVIARALFVGESARAAAVVVPGGATSTELSEGTGSPFSIGNFGLSSQRYQQVYAANEFSGLAGGGEYITQIAFRPDPFAGAAFSAVLASIRIDLSTVATGPDALSAVFGENVGANDTIVYGGASGASLFLSSSFTGPAFGPKDFDIVINLTTPFFYNPAAGNLLLDIRNFGGGTTTYFSATSASGDAMSRVFTFGSDAGSAVAGNIDSLGLVTRFTTVVPEPCGFGLVALGLLGLKYFKARTGNLKVPEATTRKRPSPLVPAPI
jgi:hypothetical protein